MNQIHRLIASPASRCYAALRRRLKASIPARDPQHREPGEQLPGYFFQVGRQRILLPADHALPIYRQHFKLYDVPLRVILQCVQQMGKPCSLIDIGANVGDTAAIANYETDVPVLCIDGDPLYLPYLRRNSRAIGSHLEIAECLVSDKPAQIDPAQLTRSQGTTSATAALQSTTGGSTPVRRLDDILSEHPRFVDAAVLKTDTDGHDFAIISGHCDFLKQHQPIVHMEYTVASAGDAADAVACLGSLFAAGYRHFVVFDNFGNLWTIKHPEADAVEAMASELNSYLLSNQLFGTAVYYFDVCAFTDRFASLDQLIAARYAQFIAAGRVLDGQSEAH